MTAPLIFNTCAQIDQIDPKSFNTSTQIDQIDQNHLTLLLKSTKSTQNQKFLPIWVVLGAFQLIKRPKIHISSPFELFLMIFKVENDSKSDFFIDLGRF